jgi:uncharacterized protein (TIGR00369 family)
MTPTHFHLLEKLFAKARINTKLYPTAKIDVSKGACIIHLDITNSYHHGMEAVHGSVYFKMLDDAAYFAANSVVEDCYLLTTNFNIHMLRPIASGKIKASGSLRMKSRHLWIADAVLHDQNGKEIAYGTGHFSKSNTPITPV